MQVSHARLALLGRVQPVVGLAKDRSGEQFLAIEVARERARFAQQRVDHVPIIDAGLLSMGTRTHGHRFTSVMEADLGLAYPRFNPRADQARWHRIGAVLHPSR